MRITGKKIRQAILVSESDFDEEQPPEYLALFDEAGNHFSPEGITGPPGDDGDPGPPGLPGDKWYVFPSSEDVPDPMLAEEAPSGSHGDMALIEDTGDVFQKLEGAWYSAGNIKGPVGDDGTEGPPGDVGPIGPASSLPFRKRSGAYHGSPGQKAPEGFYSDFGIGYIVALPLWVPEAFTVDMIGVNVEVPGDSGTLLRLGIYNDDGAMRPSSLKNAGGVVLADTVGFKSIGPISAALTVGLYWLAIMPLGGAPQMTGWITSLPIPSTDGNAGPWKVSGIVSDSGHTGAFPGSFPIGAEIFGDAENHVPPNIVVRAA